MKEPLKLPILLTMIFCIAIFAATATAQAAVVKEKLADGSYVVAIDGADYKALSSSTLRDIAVREDTCREARANLDQQIAHYENERKLFDTDRKLADMQAAL